MGAGRRGQADGVAFLAMEGAGANLLTKENFSTLATICVYSRGNYIERNTYVMKKKVGKVYSVPTGLLKRFKTLPINTSAAISLAIQYAHDDDSKLVKALHRRLGLTDTPANEEEQALSRVNSTFNPEIVDMLTSLSRRSDLPIEHALRLAMEAFVFKL